ncbi:MAG TPA: cytochrome c [Rhodocyclaceae bacterium]|nr:cytochrome c [Rhodocyclaceae bacterium]
MRRVMKIASMAFLASWAFVGLAPMAHAADGKAVFESHCAACHQPDGAGAVGLAPPLAGTLGQRVAVPAGRAYIPGVLVSGLAGKIESKGNTYNGIMPNWVALSDDELASVANYVLEAFNKDLLAADHRAYTADDMAEARAHKPTGKELKALRVESEAKTK